MRDFAPRQRRPTKMPSGSSSTRAAGPAGADQAGRIRAILRGSGVQPKLEIGEPDSPQERDADRAADEIVGAAGGGGPDLAAASPPALQRVCEDCEEEVQTKPDDTVQRQAEEEDEDLVLPKAEGQPNQDGAPSTDSIVRDGVSGGGHRLPSGLGSFFGTRFGHDFSDVRLHTDSRAASSAKAISAKAYTVGSDVVFGAGQYTPYSQSGRWLIAHELAHVAQGRGGGSPAAQRSVEDDANAAATDVMAGKAAQVEERRDADKPALFGEPQHVPDVTFIAGQNPRGDGFLNAAIEYHNAWRLRPRTIDSMQDIVNHLAGGSGDIGRIRIVTHASRTNLFMAMFEGGTPGILEGVLNGFAQSAGAGMHALLGPGLVDPQTVSDIVTHLRNNNAAVLAPFGLDQPAASPAGAVEQLILRSAELLMHTTGAADPGLTQAEQAEATRQAPIITASLGPAIDELKRQVQLPAPDGAGVTAQQADDLHAAILGINTFVFTLAPQPADFVTDLEAANRATAGNFYQNLARVRARFKSNSWIDIRGCRVGGTQSYMRAVQDFFGQGADKPHVSAPDWWQTFPLAGYRTIVDGDIAGLAGDVDVQTALDHWFTVAGIESHLRAMIILHQDMLIRAQRQEIEAQRRQLQPPGLSGGLQLPQDLGIVPPMLPGIDLPQLELSGGLGTGSGPSLAPTGSLTNPLIASAQQGIDSNRRELERIGNFTTEEKLRYYLQMALVLPLRVGGNAEDVQYLMLHRLRERAMDNWLGSIWAERAPGLRRLQRANYNAEDARRLEAVVDQDPQQNVTDMFFSPDTEYDAHIKKI